MLGYKYRPKCKSLPLPAVNQPVRVRLQYTGWRVVERWLTLPNLNAYYERFAKRYRPFQTPGGMSRLRRRFQILEVTWDGKPTD